MTPDEQVLALLARIPETDRARLLADLERYLPPTEAALNIRHAEADTIEGPPPWTAGDIRWAARGLGWPEVALPDGRVVAGQDSWEDALDTADGRDLLALHRSLREGGTEAP